MTVELVADIGHMLNLGRDREAHGGEAANLSQQRHQPVAVINVEFAITVI